MKLTLLLFTCCVILCAQKAEAQNFGNIFNSITDLTKNLQQIVEIGYQNPDIVKTMQGINESMKKSCSSLSSLGFPPTQYLVKRACIVRNDIEIIYNDLMKLQ
ncbi:hypothetical protein ACFFRR_007871 [Megaselia abdita]